MTAAECTIDECTGKVEARGLCNRHYLKLRRSGLPAHPVTFETRFWGRMVENPASGCWEWLGSVRRGGYGQIALDGVKWSVHRLSYTILVGDIPEGLQIDHLCRNRLCANPDHLDPVPLEVNVLRGMSPPAQLARASMCMRGHPFDVVNTYVAKSGKRNCRQCRRQRDERKAS